MTDGFQERDGAVVVEVSVRPRAGRCRVAGIKGGRLRVEVTSAPEGGEATRQALATLAAACGLKAAQATLLRGLRERHKVVRLEGISLASCIEKLGGMGG